MLDPTALRSRAAGRVAGGHEEGLQRLAAIPSIPLVGAPTPLEELPRLREALGGGPRLLVKRDDSIPFGFGGNKVRKLELVAAAAIEAGADTLVTLGGIQSNHARATAATAAKLGLRCVILANGRPPERPTANALLDALLGAEVEYIPTRAERSGALAGAMARLRRAGREPFAVPLGASTPLGALGFARAVGELLEQGPAPDVIIHASSSGGTQAGLVAGCALHGIETRVLGVSADDPAAEIERAVHGLVRGVSELLRVGGPPGWADSRGAGVSLPATERLTGDAAETDSRDAGTGERSGRTPRADAGTRNPAADIEVDDGFVGTGYGQSTAASREAQLLAARTEALFLDHTYTAKAMAALIAYVRAARFRADETVTFWHTGGQVGIFACPDPTRNSSEGVRCPSASSTPLLLATQTEGRKTRSCSAARAPTWPR